MPLASRASTTASNLAKLSKPIYKPGGLPGIPGIIPVKNEKTEDKDEEAPNGNGEVKSTLKAKKTTETAKYLAPHIGVSQQIHTVFFSGMPKINDKALDALLALLPTITGWVRLKDVRGFRTESGFVHFNSAIGVAVALRCLGEVTVTSGEEERKITVTCEENSKMKIEDVDDTLIVAETGQSPSNLIDSMQAVIEGNEAEEDEEDEEDEEELPLSSITFEEDPFFDVIEPDRTNLKNDIKNFRGAAVSAEKDAYARRGEFGKMRMARRTTAADKALGSVGAAHIGSTSSRASDTRLSEQERQMYREFSRELQELENKDPITDEEYAARIIDEREDEVEAEFIEQQKRWLSHEDGRLRDLIVQWKQIVPEELEKNRQAAMSRLLAYDDDKERAKERHIYYYDHATWSRNRALFREEEIKREEEDAEEGEEAEVSAPAGPITISLKPKEDVKETDVLSKSVTVPDVERLTEFVGEQVEEYLGVKEEDLIKFIVEHVVAGKSAKELVTELEGPLDEDGAILVKNVWEWLS